MRKAKTIDVLNVSVNSESKHRMTRDELKKYKIDRLRLKFKNVVHRLDALKKQTNQDYQQLIISSERLERMALQSQQKTKRIGIDSLEAKRRLTLPSTLEASEISNFTLKDQVFIKNGQTGSKALKIGNQETFEKVPSGVQEKAGDLFYSKVDSKITATNELRNSSESIRKEVEFFITAEDTQMRLKQSLIKQYNILEKSIRRGNKLQNRRNRFEEEWTVPSKPLDILIPLRAKNTKHQQTIRPYILAMAFSIILLAALSY